jgi:hypothetical protein
VVKEAKRTKKFNAKALTPCSPCGGGDLEVMTVSKEKFAANRENSKRSTGPRSAAGKSVVALNALRHGLRAERPVVPGLERPEDYEVHRDAIVSAIEPLGALEKVLAERVASILWRLERVARFESDVIARDLADAEHDFDRQGRLVATLSAEPMAIATPTHPVDIRSRASSSARARRLLERIVDLPDELKLSTDDALSLFYLVEVVGERIARQNELEIDLGARTSVRVDVDFDAEQLSYPGIPDGVALEDFSEWTVGILRGCIGVIGSAVDVRPEDILAGVLQHARDEERAASLQAEACEAELVRVRSLRTLPNADTSEKIIKYEGHLHRLLERTLHEIQRLQAMRLRGTAAAPAAVDVTISNFD